MTSSGTTGLDRGHLLHRAGSVMDAHAVRYIDTGARDTASAVGTWLRALCDDAASARSLRVQSGFFAATALGFLKEIIDAVRDADGAIYFVLGSNNGETKRTDLEILLEIVGQPRPGTGIAVVNFGNAFFHPKTIHVRRKDGSEVAYVGSANLTGSGVRSLNIEAGILLDTLDSDAAGVTGAIGSAVDWWFAQPRAGAHIVESAADLDELEATGVIGVVQPKVPTLKPRQKDWKASTQARLTPLVTSPIFKLSGGSPTTPDQLESAPRPTDASSSVGIDISTEYWKTITPSDAQRKGTGNQRGSITMTGRESKVVTQTYFRFDLFANVDWVTEKTRTGEVLESAHIPMSVRVNGDNLGVQVMEVTYAPNREEGQNNYTTLLHLGPLTDVFTSNNLAGEILRILRLEDNTFALSIATQ